MRSLPSQFLLLLLTSLITAEDRTIDVEGIPREYILEVPSSYDGSAPYSLVIVYHGMTGTARQFTFTGFHSSGGDDRFLTVYPQGLNDIPNFFAPGETTTGWKFETVDNRDVAFTRAVIEELAGEFNLIPGGIYITGMSNGGFMSDILGCAMGDDLAAIAPVVGGTPLSPSSQCTATRPLPVMHLGSAHDAIVEISYLRSATAFWVDHNGSGPDPVSEGFCDVYTGSEERSEVRHCEFACLVNDQPVSAASTSCHTWPTAWTGYDFETTDMVLSFFRAHGLGSEQAVSFQGDISGTSTGPLITAVPGGMLLRRTASGSVSLDFYKPDGRLDFRWTSGGSRIADRWFIPLERASSSGRLLFRSGAAPSRQ